MTPIRSQPAWGMFNAPASITLGTVAMILGPRLNPQAAGSISQATSWPVGHWIGMGYSARMVMLRTGRITVGWAVEAAVLAMAMTMTTARVRRTCNVVRKEPSKGAEQRMVRGKDTRKGREMRRQWSKCKGKGIQTVKGQVLVHNAQGEMLSLVPLLCSFRRKCKK